MAHGRSSYNHFDQLVNVMYILYIETSTRSSYIVQPADNGRNTCEVLTREEGK